MNLKPLRIGSLKLKHNVVLAPMVDVTDIAYRLLCRRAGAALAYTEMLHVESLLHENLVTKRKIQTTKEDTPLGIQITGKEISHFANVSSQFKRYALVDVNCGCPGHLTIDHGSGSYLLNDPRKIGAIIRALKKQDLLVTAKIRLGFKKNNVVRIAKTIERAGADALTLHPRLASQGRGVAADWSWLSKIKKEIGIPLIGNGDVFTGADAKKILDVCDGVMIARGGIGDPLVFKRVLTYLKTGKEEEELNVKKNLSLYLEYLALAKKYGVLSLGKAKYLGGKFLRGFNGAPEARNTFMRLNSYAEMEKFFKKILKEF